MVKAAPAPTPKKAAKGKPEPKGKAEPKAKGPKAQAAKPAPEPTAKARSGSHHGGGIAPATRAAADALKQASDPTRLEILLFLQPQEQHVTAICEALGTASQPAVSHHLALLRHGKLIQATRAGKHNYYALTHQGRTLAELAERIMADAG